MANGRNIEKVGETGKSTKKPSNTPAYLAQKVNAADKLKSMQAEKAAKDKAIADAKAKAAKEKAAAEKAKQDAAAKAYKEKQAAAAKAKAAQQAAANKAKAKPSTSSSSSKAKPKTTSSSSSANKAKPKTTTVTPSKTNTQPTGKPRMKKTTASTAKQPLIKGKLAGEQPIVNKFKSNKENDTFAIDELYNTLMDSAQASLDNPYIRPEYTNVITPRLRTAQELANIYGIDYNKDNINAKFNNAVADAYKQRYADQTLSDNTYYNNLAALNDTAQSNARTANGAAIASGASKGMQAANQLAAMLGISQQSADGATELAQTRSKLAGERTAAQSQAAVDALKYYDTLGTQLGGMARQLYSDDIQEMTSQLGYNQAANTDYAGNATQEMASDAAVRQAELAALADAGSANQAAQAAAYSADQNVKAYKGYGVDAAGINAVSGEKIAGINANAQMAAAQTSAAAQLAAAQAQANAYKSASSGSYYKPASSAGKAVGGVTGKVSPKKTTGTSTSKSTMNQIENGVKSGKLTDEEGSALTQQYMKSGTITPKDYSSSMYNRPLSAQQMDKTYGTHIAGLGTQPSKSSGSSSSSSSKNTKSSSSSSSSKKKK